MTHETIHPGPSGGMPSGPMSSDHTTTIIHEPTGTAGPGGGTTRVTEIIHDGPPSFGGPALTRVTEVITETRPNEPGSGRPGPSTHKTTETIQGPGSAAPSGKNAHFADEEEILGDPAGSQRPGPLSDRMSEHTVQQDRPAKSGFLGGRSSKPPSSAFRRDDPYDDRPVQGLADVGDTGGSRTPSVASKPAPAQRPTPTTGPTAAQADPSGVQAEPSQHAVQVKEAWVPECQVPSDANLFSQSSTSGTFRSPR